MLKKYWTKIKEFFGIKNTGKMPVASGKFFPTIDPEEMAEYLKIQSVGEEHGKKNYPLTDSVVLTDIEKKIIYNCSDVYDESKEIFHDGINNYNQRLQNVLSKMVNNVESIIAQESRNQFPVISQLATNELYIARKNVISYNKEYEDFKLVNKIEREAKYGASKFLSISLIFFLIVTEGILNGMFIGETHELGLMGGISEAFVISLVNVMAGLLVGIFFLPFLNHIMFIKKLVGSCTVLMYIFLISVFNLAVAHYRDALSQDHWHNATTIALENLISNPFGIYDLKSWMLFGLGYMFSMIALYKGYKWDDPYPGYGYIDRKMKEILQDYAEISENWLLELKEYYEKSIVRIRGVHIDSSKFVGEYKSIICARNNFLVCFKDQINHINKSCNLLLSVYRESNRQSRTEKPPKYFDTDWRIEHEPLPVFNDKNEPKFEEQYSISIEKHISEVYSAFIDSMDKIKSIEQLDEKDINFALQK